MLMRFPSRDFSTIIERITPTASRKRLSGIWKPRNSTDSLRSKHPAEIMSGRPELAVEFQPGFTHQWTHPGVTLQAEPCLCWALCYEGICTFSWGKWEGCGGNSHGVRIGLTTSVHLNLSSPFVVGRKPQVIYNWFICLLVDVWKLSTNVS